MSLTYAAVGVSAVVFGLVMILRPESVARWRNSGAVNSEPTSGMVRLTRYVGGPSLVLLGAILTVSSF